MEAISPHLNARVSSCSKSKNSINVSRVSKCFEAKAPYRQNRRNSHKFTLLQAQAVATPAEPPAPTPSPVKQEKPVEVVKLTEDVFLVRGKCEERLKFEIEYGLKAGTTENSYLIKAPALKIFCSNPTFKTIEAALSAPQLQTLEITVVKAGTSLDLGGGHELQFLLAPTPRWPDAMLTYDPLNCLLFSQKWFSCHVSASGVFDIGGWEKYGDHWRFFFDCMLAPVARQANLALEKLPIVGQFSVPSYSGKSGLDVVKADLGYIWSTVARALNLSISQSAAFSKTPFNPQSSTSLVVSAICPLHGPIIRSTLTELVREYKVWTAEKVKAVDVATVAVIYASAYGNTSAMAQAISKGILKAGVGCETVNCEFSTKDEIKDLIKKSGGFVIGSPTLGGHMPTPVQEALGVILSDPGARAKPCGVFGSFGWSGEAVDELEKRLKDGGFSFAFPAIRCKFKPTEQMVQTCEESGTDIAQSVRKKLRKEKSTKVTEIALASSVEQAVGRIVGALCVVSAKSGDAESAMLASWVSQASFNPPGITLAVAKERAIEGLVLPGGEFVLNVLGGDKVAPVSRQLLKPFKPGEARFGDLETSEASNGAKILKDAIAFLECKVQTRMETGDHWVLYATVTNGNLQNDKALTAVHHRKSGARY